MTNSVTNTVTNSVTTRGDLPARDDLPERGVLPCRVSEKRGSDFPRFIVASEVRN